jgi:hypothetical protein
MLTLYLFWSDLIKGCGSLNKVTPLLQEDKATLSMICNDVVMM